MTAGYLITILDVLLIVHAAGTGRFLPWGLLILFLPGVGALVYVAFELAPEWFGSYRTQRAGRSVVQALNPTGRYRALKEQLDVVDTVANRSTLAEECLKIGRPQEALEHYEAILARPLGDEPAFLIGKARALLDLGRADEAVATLEEARAHAPDFHSPMAVSYSHARSMRLGWPTRRSALTPRRRARSLVPSRGCARRGFWSGSGDANRPARSPKTLCASSNARRATCSRTSASGSRSPGNSPADRGLAQRVSLRDKRAGVDFHFGSGGSP